jgi:hypothetical protein
MPRASLLPLAALLLSTGCGGAGAGETSIPGSYDTRVSVVSASEGCVLPVADNPTVVELTSRDSVVTLTHAGTTYGGLLRRDRTFTTEPKRVAAGGIDYRMVVSGQFGADSLDAEVTLDYGQSPACRVVVRWVGPKQRS